MEDQVIVHPTYSCWCQIWQLNTISLCSFGTYRYPSISRQLKGNRKGNQNCPSMLTLRSCHAHNLIYRLIWRLSTAPQYLIVVGIKLPFVLWYLKTRQVYTLHFNFLFLYFPLPFCDLFIWNLYKSVFCNYTKKSWK